MEFFLSKSEVCDTTLMSGAFDKSVINGKTILLEISEKCGKNRYLHIGGDMICSVLTNGNFYKYISNMGNNLTLYSVAVGHENIYFFTPHFNFIKRDKINENELLKTKASSVDPFDYHVSNFVIHSFIKLRI